MRNIFDDRAERHHAVGVSDDGGERHCAVDIFDDDDDDTKLLRYETRKLGEKKPMKL